MNTAVFPAVYADFGAWASGRSATFFLAAEEYLARHREETFVLLWQTRATCVVGRHQVVQAEVDLDFCRRHNIEVVRRKSGGGAIFSDGNNVMVSLVCGDGEVAALFRTFGERLVEALATMGVAAHISGRNDLLLDDGRKFSGHAFYKIGRRNIVHCTLLYDTDPRLMGGALRPSREKLAVKGVRSVESRVGTLRERLPFGLDELKTRLRSCLCASALTLSADDVKEIERIEQTYRTPEHLRGTAVEASLRLSGRVEGCGEVGFLLDLDGDLIRRVGLSGDFFERAGCDAEPAFDACLRGRRFNPDDVAAALALSHPEQTISGLHKDDILQILFQTRDDKNKNNSGKISGFFQKQILKINQL